MRVQAINNMLSESKTIFNFYWNFFLLFADALNVIGVVVVSLYSRMFYPD